MSKEIVSGMRGAGKNERPDPYREAIKRAIDGYDWEDEIYIGNEPVFRLCRELRGVDGDRDPTELRPFVREWFEIAKGQLAGVESNFCDVPKTWPEVWALFVQAWPKVRFTGNIIREVLATAKADTRPVPELGDLETPTTLLLARICRALQNLVGDGPFWLSTVDAAEVIGRGRKIAHSLLRMFETLRILECVKRGNARQATRYRYIGVNTRLDASTTALSSSSNLDPHDTETAEIQRPQRP